MAQGRVAMGVATLDARAGHELTRLDPGRGCTCRGVTEHVQARGA
jgi:hypothetical protein